MRYVEVAPTRIVRAEQAVFTYHTELPVTVGHLVTIPIGSRQAEGMVTRVVDQPAYPTKEIVGIIEPTPVPGPLVELALWIAEYYATPLATVLQTLLPRGLQKKRRAKSATQQGSVRDRTKNVLNRDQRRAVGEILARPSGTTLLQGVTGSGKTEVYKSITRHTLEAGRSVIILVPEIGLTQQVVDELSTDFPDALLTHSRMTEAQRHLVWTTALTSDKPVIAIGPRSALFLPVPQLGAIIVDEAHEPSYKQEQSPRYSALRVASVLGTLTNSRVIFGSATPLVADRYVAEQSGTPIIRLDQRARNEVTAASVQLVDMTERDPKSQHAFLSAPLIEALERTLKDGQQALLFHNRRGSAGTTLCQSCGWTATCPHCYIPLVLHADSFQLTCHVCQRHQAVPLACPSCGAAEILHKGIGTKRIESELRRLFPRARIARFDSDNTDSETLAARYSELYNGEVDIIIGTQVVAKGLDLPRLQTVGVIQADSGLALPDFMAAERTFQLLAQVVGRVGRDSRETQVIIQSYQAHHPVVQFGIQQDYEGFYEYAIAERQRAGFPPFRYLLQLTTVYKTESRAITASRALAKELRSRVAPDVEIFGPTPAFYERQHDTYRWQLLLKSPRRQALIDSLRFLPPAHWQSELDPNSLL